MSPASVCETCVPKLWPWMPSGLFRKFSALSMTSPKRARHETSRSWTSSRQPDLAELLEDAPVDGEEPDQGRAGARAEHHLQGALEGEDVGVESRARRHLGEQILDVVELPRVAERVGEVVDLLPKQEALFVVEHVRSLRPMRHGRLAAACPQSAGGRTRGRARAAWSPPPRGRPQPCRRQCACRPRDARSWRGPTRMRGP